LRWGHGNFFRNGRLGQKQDGVDIYGSEAASDIIGIQCKNTNGHISESLVLKEIEHAEQFLPALDVLYIATTCSRDGTLQRKLRLISEDRAARHAFPVYLLFWDDILSDLAKEDAEFFKHFPEYAPSKNPARPRQGRPTFSADELDIRRHATFGGKRISASQLAAIGRPMSVFAFVFIQLSLFSVLPKDFQNWLPLVIFIFALGIFFIIVPMRLRRRKFEHVLFRKYYLELSDNDKLMVHRLSASCPWCNSIMQLRHVGEKNAPRDYLFICERNPRQHTVLLDPTALPPLDDR
jgi:hypothetical protein